MEDTRKRKQLTKLQVKFAVAHLNQKLLARLKQKGWGTFASSHEALGIITEEMHELTDAVQHNATGNAHVREELLDIAVAAVFAVACIDAGTLDW